jgi:hypothetical protein
VWWLTAPNLASTTGVTLGGATILNDGHWALRPERLPRIGTTASLELRPATGALVFLE